MYQLYQHKLSHMGESINCACFDGVFPISTDTKTPKGERGNKDKGKKEQKPGFP